MDRARFAQQERSLYRHNRLNPLIGSQPIVTPGLEPSLTSERASGKWLEKCIPQGWQIRLSVEVVLSSHNALEAQHPMLEINPKRTVHRM